MLPASIVIRSESGAPIIIPILLEGGRRPQTKIDDTHGAVRHESTSDMLIFLQMFRKFLRKKFLLTNKFVFLRRIGRTYRLVREHHYLRKKS